MRYAIDWKALAALVLSVAWLTTAHGQAKDPAIGSWKLNLEKSKYSPGPPPKEMSLKFESAGKALRNTTHFVGADGKALNIVYTAEADGKDYPLTGSAVADTVSLKKLPDGSIERTDKKDGKVIQTMVRTMSKDGKSMTITQKRKTEKGLMENVMVVEKQ